MRGMRNAGVRAQRHGPQAHHPHEALRALAVDGTALPVQVVAPLAKGMMPGLLAKKSFSTFSCPI